MPESRSEGKVFKFCPGMVINGNLETGTIIFDHPTHEDRWLLWQPDGMNNNYFIENLSEETFVGIAEMIAATHNMAIEDEESRRPLVRRRFIQKGGGR